MKRSFSLIALSLSITACGGGGGSDSTPTTPVTPTPTPTTYTVTVTTSDGGSSSVTSEAVNENSTLAITLTPDSGYELTRAEGCDGTLNGTTYTTGAITATCTVSATFSEIDTTVNVTSAAQSGGMLYPSSVTTQQGERVSMTLVPDVTNMIDAVSGCNGSLKGNVYSFTASESCEVSATFTPQSDTTTRSSTGGQKTLVLPVSFAGRDSLEDFGTDDLTALFITDADAINQYVVNASEGAAWLEPHVMSNYTLTATDTTSSGETYGFSFIDNEVMLGDAQLQEIYAWIAENVADYTSYDRLITVINDSPNTPYVCYASLNHSNVLESWDHYAAYTASECVSKATLLHNLGHTFGMRHTNASRCEALPAASFAYRSTEDCAEDGDESPFPMGDIDDHEAAFTAPMRNLAGWLTTDNVMIATAASDVDLAQSSSPAGGVQLLRVPYARDANGDAVYINFEVKTPIGPDASLFEEIDSDAAYQLMVSIPQTRYTTGTNSPLDALYLMPEDESTLGITEDYVDTYRGITVNVNGTQGTGEALTVSLSVTPPALIPQPALSTLPGAAANETVTVTLTNESDSTVSGLSETLDGLNAAYFTIQSSTCAGATLASDASCTVVVARTSNNPALAAVRFSSDSGAVQQAEVEAIAINQTYDSAATLEWMTLSDYPRMSLFEAVAFCERREDGGNTDWRVPMQEELNAAFVESATPPLDLGSATYDRYFWSVSIAADLSMNTLAVTSEGNSMADSPRSSIRHVVCTRTL